MKLLTSRQKEVLRYLRRFSTEYGWMPSMAETCRDMGWASTQAAQDHFESLERKGAIVRGEKYAPRCIRIVIDDKEFSV